MCEGNAHAHKYMHPVVQPDFGLLWKWNKWSDSIFWLYVRSCRIHTHSCCTLQSIALLGLLWAQCRYVASVVNSGGGISSSSTWEKYDYGKITCKSILGKEICCLMATINCSRISLGIVYLYAVCSVYRVYTVLFHNPHKKSWLRPSLCVLSTTLNRIETEWKQDDIRFEFRAQSDACNKSNPNRIHTSIGYSKRACIYFDARSFVRQCVDKPFQFHQKENRHRRRRSCLNDVFILFA